MSTPLKAALSPSTVAELEAIDTARTDAFAALQQANRDGLTGDAVAALIDTMDEVKRREEAVHRRTFPRHRGTLVVVNGMALLTSPTGRSTRIVWERRSTSHAANRVTATRATFPRASARSSL